MTNAELIKALRRCSYMTVADALNEDYCKPCVYYTGDTADVTCIDRMMIDAADALEAAEQRIADQQKQIAKLNILLNNKIEELEAQFLKEGEWIGIEYDGYADGCPVYDLWECSECGEEHNGEEDTLPNYCPNCGAKMKGEKEEKEAQRQQLSTSTGGPSPK